MNAVLESCHYPEVAAATPKPPEEVVVLFGAHLEKAAVRGHQVGRDQVVTGEAVLAVQVADSSAERESRDAGRGHDPAGRGETEGLGLVVDVAPRRSAFGASRAFRRIDAHAVHPRKIDHEPAVAHGVPGHAVAASANRYEKIVVAGERHRSDHVGGARTSYDERRVPVDHRVEDRAGAVVAVLAGTENAAADPRAKALERRVREHFLSAGECGESHVIHDESSFDPGSPSGRDPSQALGHRGPALLRHRANHRRHERARRSAHGTGG